MYDLSQYEANKRARSYVWSRPLTILVLVIALCLLCFAAIADEAKDVLKGHMLVSNGVCTLGEDVKRCQIYSERVLLVVYDENGNAIQIEEVRADGTHRIVWVAGQGI